MSAVRLRFTATFAIPTADRSTIMAYFFHDDTLGLLTVIREGDSFLDSTIRLNFGEMIREAEKSGLNDRGEVAFAYTLVNGEQGVAIWTVPEPSAAWLLRWAWLLACLRWRSTEASADRHRPDKWRITIRYGDVDRSSLRREWRAGTGHAVADRTRCPSRALCASLRRGRG